MHVRTKDLSPIIKNFIERHNSEHPMRMGGNNHINKEVHTPVVQGREYICKRAGIGTRRLQSVVDCEHDVVTFTLADKIMCAIDRPEVFVNGEVEIIK